MNIVNEIGHALSKLKHDVGFTTKTNTCEQLTRKYHGKSVELVGEVGGVLIGKDYDGILLLNFNFDVYIPFFVFVQIEFPSLFFIDLEKQYEKGKTVKVHALIKYIRIDSSSDMLFNIVCSAE